MKQFGYFVLACGAIVLIGWVVSKITGSRAYFVEDWVFEEGETVLWSDPEADSYLIPKLGQAVVMSFARLRRGSVVVTNRRIVIGSLPLRGKKHMVQYVLYPQKTPGTERLDGGLLTVGYQTIAYDPASLVVHATKEKPHIDLTPLPSETSSTNLETIRIFTDLAATFRLSAAKTLSGERPLVIGHRGAAGHLPDHTLEGYKLAIEMGADFVEPDLVATKDGVLIARHEPMLGATTDIADRPEFAKRKNTYEMDGANITDWFASDLTLAEVKGLRAKQPLTERDPSKNGVFAIPTLDEIIALVKAESARLGRPIGIYPETKHPSHHVALGLPLEDRLLKALADAGWTSKTSPVIVQSFDSASLKALRAKTSVRLAQLVPGETPITRAVLEEIKTYADGVAPAKSLLLPSENVDRDADGKPDDLNADGVLDERDRVLLAGTSLVQEAHDVGLFVHTWTLRSEPRRLLSDYAGNPAAEYQALYALGVDGVFTDFPDAAVEARSSTIRLVTPASGSDKK